MVNDFQILESALKHGITVPEIHFVLSDKNPTRRFHEMHDDADGNPQEMCVAHTGTRPWPIEVGVSYRENENIIFHASRATPEYLELYEAEP